MVVEISLGLSFPVTNNTAEYEAFLAVKGRKTQEGGGEHYDKK